jgi:hypothetical protein
MAEVASPDRHGSRRIKKAQDYGHDKQDDENEEDDFGDFGRGRGNPGKPEDGRDNGYHQKNQSPDQHSIFPYIKGYRLFAAGHEIGAQENGQQD